MTRQPVTSAGYTCAESGGRPCLGTRHSSPLEYPSVMNIALCCTLWNRRIMNSQSVSSTDGAGVWRPFDLRKKLDLEPNSKMEDTAEHAPNHEQTQNAFPQYGNIKLSNNLVKNAIRPFVVGQKTCVFAIY